MNKATCTRCLYFDSCSHKGLCEYFYDASQEDQMAEEYIDFIKEDYANQWRTYIRDYND